ncbi:phage baseplate assembly protein V [Pseudonocardia charpentierae]|uniref:Phage baseplate assembly protein V n=1 Tax=Pseudonocardia charpentierae TaxID=3075545 RepID=A0ABU2NGP0_9PSEU|nr:phage baseplate assembly protein V [Pseudonocardia sp. DSM 45834]MDT0353133.1 phage baseplate assembly protein V [Pseudonocardia sp. DSM 45834]
MTTAFFAPRARIDISGVTLAADVSRHVLSVRYDNDVELADMFTIVLDNAGNRFTDSPLFAPGKDVELHMGYGDDLHPMMLGEIAAIEPSFPQSGAQTITVSGYDRSQRLRHSVPDRPAFLFTNDSLMATQVALEAGLIPIVDPSPFPPEEALPRTAPDMTILKERAYANYFEVFVRWDKLFFRFPRPQTEMVELEWGRNLSSFSPRLSYAGLAGVQIVRGYNADLAQNIVGVMAAATLDLDDVLERLGEAGIATLARLGARTISTGKVTSPIDALALAKAMLQQILDGMYEASGSCIGLPALLAGQFIEVSGVGKRFSGRYRLSRVSHTLDASGYRTDFDVTQRAEASVLGLLRKATFDTPSPHKREPIHGVVVGTVRAVDPILYKLWVNLPNTPPTDQVKVSCATFMAGDGRGAYFLPEIGDQVLLAFVDGEITRGYALGCLWRAGPKPAQLPGVQRLRSRAGHTITLDDNQRTIAVEHPGGAAITMAADGSVKVTAGLTGGDLTFEAPAGDIAFTSLAGTVNLQAAKDVTVGATGRVTVTAGTDVTVGASGGGVSVTAGKDLTLTATAGQATVNAKTGIALNAGGSKVTVTTAQMDVTGVSP